MSSYSASLKKNNFKKLKRKNKTKQNKTKKEKQKKKRKKNIFSKFRVTSRTTGPTVFCFVLFILFFVLLLLLFFALFIWIHWTCWIIIWQSKCFVVVGFVCVGGCVCVCVLFLFFWCIGHVESSLWQSNLKFQNLLKNWKVCKEYILSYFLD